MIGRKVSHYRVVSELGRGGMGVVYRAQDETLGRDVALKILPADSVTDEQARRRLIEEARLASSLNHPHICTIYEAGEAEGQIFFAMELVVGRSLREHIPVGGMSEESVARYGAQIADALAHAHGRGVIHRDLKPANVIVTPEGRAKVLDFGLAQRQSRAELEEVTRSQLLVGGTGAVAGTLAYMAPEQLRGEPADARSDVWALGVVLYEMASGKMPFSGTTGFELSSAILRETPTQLPERVPPPLRAVIQRCLLKEPAQRYQHAGEIRAALETLGTVTAAPSTAVATPRPRAIPWKWPTAAAAVLVVIAAAFVLNVSDLRQRLFAPTGPPKIESLAVLPLENLSGDPTQEYFADGMTEALITELSKISALKVISRTSVMQYKGVKKPMPQVARELGVDALVEGSVLREGDQVRIGVQLIHGPSDHHLWAESYQRELRGILALQSEVAQAIAEEIRAKVTPQERTRLARISLVNPHAYELYLKGRFYWSERTDQGLRKSVDYFNQALEEDPTNPLAWAGLADAYLQMGGEYRVLPPPEARPRAKAAALKALELDPNLGEPHASLGLWYYHQWEWTAAEKEFQRALELAPNYAIAHHWYALLLNSEGRDREALAHLRRAQTLDPLWPSVYGTEALFSYLAGRYEEAIEKGEKLVEVHPNFPFVYVSVGLAYVEEGKFEAGIDRLERAVGLAHRNPAPLSRLGYAYGRAGRRTDARRIARELEELSKQRYVSPFDRALVYAGLGERAQALAWLEKAYEVRDASISINNRSPWFDSLRDDPRYQDLLRRMNFLR